MRDRRAITPKRGGDARQAHLESGVAKVGRHLPGKRDRGAATGLAKQFFHGDIQGECRNPSRKPRRGGIPLTVQKSSHRNTSNFVTHAAGNPEHKALSELLDSFFPISRIFFRVMHFTKVVTRASILSA